MVRVLERLLGEHGFHSTGKCVATGYRDRGVEQVFYYLL